MPRPAAPCWSSPNEMHVYLFDRRDGRQYDATKELTVTAELPEKHIDAIELDATRAGPGHYVVTGAALGVSGDWTVEVVARVSDFDEYRTRLHVPVR
jgi:copper transport protein